MMKAVNMDRQGLIRPSLVSDIPGLKGVIGANGLFPSDMLEGMMAHHFSENTGEIWLSAHDGGPVAVAYCAPERMTTGTWNILLIAVHPDRQRQGLGVALMTHIEDQLASQHQRVLLVETSSLPDFDRARSFYRKLQYEEEARIRDFYQDGEDKIVFRKALRRIPQELQTQ